VLEAEMERERVTSVTGSGRGSGYLVAPRLVLTTARAAGAPDESASVSLAGRDGSYTGRVVWRGASEDAALVLIEDPGWTPPPGGIRWGRLVTADTDVRCQTWGTDASLDGTVRGGGGDRYPVTLDDSGPAEPGSPVFADGLLIGIVAEHDGAALETTPVALLWTDEDFVAALTAHGAGGELAAVELASTPAPTGTPGSPAGLLAARRAVVPFHGRELPLAELCEWAARPGQGLWLVHGPAGQGKTRLAHELGRRLAPDGWAVAWLSATAGADDIAVLAHIVVPTLIIVDEAETRRAQLATLLHTMAGSPAPVKVLLLTRTTGSWWHDLDLTDDKRCEFVLTGAHVRELGVLEHEVRRDTYRLAVAALADALPTVPGSAGTDWVAHAGHVMSVEGRFPSTAPVLPIQLTALADLLDAADPPAQPPTEAEEGSPTNRVLAHERRHWQATAASLGLDAGELTDIVAATVLTDPPIPGEADCWLARIPAQAAKSVDQRREVGDWLAATFPADGPQWAFGRPRPDRLAERLVADLLRAHPTDSVAHTLAAEVTDADAVRLLTVWTGVAAYAAVPDEVAAELTRLCRQHPDTLAVAASDVVPHAMAPAPLLAALDQLADDDTLETATLEVLTTADYSSRLAATDATRIRLLVERYRRDDQDVPSTATKAALGEALRRLALRESDDDEAIAASTEAVELFRQLAEKEPDTHLPQLVRGLTNHADLLSDLGDRQEEALAAVSEAVELGRRLADQAPQLHLPRLTRNLDIQATWLGEAGQIPEALELNAKAIRRYQRLAEQDPAAYRPELAKSLSNRASLLCEMERWREALAAQSEALESFRPLTAQHPDSGLVVLIRLLDNRGIILRSLSRQNEAAAAHGEATDAARHYTALDPDARLPAFADRLTTMCQQLAEMRMLVEALAASEEALELNRHLAVADPDNRLPALSAALYNHAIDLRLVGRTPDALAVIGEAVELDRRLVERDAQNHLVYLAGSLGKQAAWLGEQEQWEDALAAVYEAIKIRRLLAWESPAEHLRDLGRLVDLRDDLDEQDTEALTRYYPANYAAG
jgi:hypothetical protein